MRPLYVLGQSGFVDLAGEIRAVTSAGVAVLWVSGSGTRQILARTDGLLTRRRYSAGNVHPGDGWALIVEEPWTATSCGLSCGSGYRSTQPLLVAVVESDADVRSAWELAIATAHRVTRTGTVPSPPGHPDDPCGALYCTVLEPPRDADGRDRPGDGAT